MWSMGGFGSRGRSLSHLRCGGYGTMWWGGLGCDPGAGGGERSGSRRAASVSTSAGSSPEPIRPDSIVSACGPDLVPNRDIPGTRAARCAGRTHVHSLRPAVAVWPSAELWGPARVPPRRLSVFSTVPTGLSPRPYLLPVSACCALFPDLQVINEAIVMPRSVFNHFVSHNMSVNNNLRSTLNG